MATQITLEIPDELARDAKDFDLLDHQQILRVLRNEVDRRVSQIVNEEIHAYRAEKKSGNDTNHS